MHHTLRAFESRAPCQADKFSLEFMSALSGYCPETSSARFRGHFCIVQLDASSFEVLGRCSRTLRAVIALFIF